MKTPLIGLALIIALGFSVPDPVTAQGRRDRERLEKIEKGVDELLEKQRREERAKAEELNRQRAAEAREKQRKAKEAEQKAEEHRGVRVEDTRAEGERRRAADCATYGACPSTPQDIRDQLGQGKR